MQSQNKQKIFRVRTTIGLFVLGTLCLIGLIMSPRESAVGVSGLCIFIAGYIVRKRTAGNVEAQKPIPSTRPKQMSAVSSFALGFIGLMTSPFVWSLGFATVSLVLAVLVLSGRHYDRQPGVTSVISSAFAMSIVGLIFSCMTFVVAAMMMSISTWPVEPTMFIRGVFGK